MNGESFKDNSMANILPNSQTGPLFLQSSIGKKLSARSAEQYKNLVYLEKVVSYLMDQNKFFGCLQIELYLYFAAIMLSLIFLRQQFYMSVALMNISSALMPVCVLYIILLIKEIDQLKKSIETGKCWIRIAAIVCYLVFIVLLADQFGVFLAENVSMRDHLLVVGPLPICVDVYRLFVNNVRFGVKVRSAQQTFYWKVLFRDLFFAAVAVYATGRYIELENTFFILYIMAVVDGLIIAFIVLKALVLLLVSACRRSLDAFFSQSTRDSRRLRLRSLHGAGLSTQLHRVQYLVEARGQTLAAA